MSEAKRAVFLSPRWLTDPESVVGIPDDLLTVTSDGITRAKDAFDFNPQTRRKKVFFGIPEWGERELPEKEEGERRILVAGPSFGSGSYRAMSAIDIAAYFDVVYAESFGGGLRRNLTAEGVPTITNRELVERMLQGYEPTFEELTAELSMAEKRMVTLGGLREYVLAIRKGEEPYPQLLVEARSPRPQTAIEKRVSQASQLLLGGEYLYLQAGQTAVLRANRANTYDIYWPLTKRAIEENGDEINMSDEDVAVYNDHFATSLHPSAVYARQLVAEFWDQHPDSVRGDKGVYLKTEINKLNVGDVVLGTDSHIGELAMAMFVMAVAVGYPAWKEAVVNEGLFPYTTPESYQIKLVGELADHVDAKDLGWFIQQYFPDQTGAVMEIGGEGYRDQNIFRAAQLANMATEWGGEAIVTEFNPNVFSYFQKKGGYQGWTKERVMELYKSLQPDEGAVYAGKLEIDLGQVPSMIVFPGHHTKVRKLSEIVEIIQLDRVIFNSCSGASPEDIAILAEVLKGHTVGIKVHVHLADAETLRYVQATGLAKQLKESGVTFGAEPSCGPCMGQGEATQEGEVVLATNSRNYPGRMGKSEPYLSGACVAAVAAKLGRIPTQQEVIEHSPEILRAKQKVEEFLQKS